MYKIKIFFRFCFLKIPLKTITCKTIEETSIETAKQMGSPHAYIQVPLELIKTRDILILDNLPRSLKKVFGKRMTVTQRYI